MISRTTVKERRRRKTHPFIADTILLTLKHKPWKKVAEMLSSSRRKYPALNLSAIDHQSKEGDTIIIPGKVLAKGNLSKKIKLCAIAISGQAKEKLHASKSEFVYLDEEIRRNPKAEGIKILK